jgi:hypothetical protein
VKNSGEIYEKLVAEEDSPENLPFMKNFLVLTGKKRREDSLFWKDWLP